MLPQAPADVWPYTFDIAPETARPTIAAVFDVAAPRAVRVAVDKSHARSAKVRVRTSAAAGVTRRGRRGACARNRRTAAALVIVGGPPRVALSYPHIVPRLMC